MVINKTYPVQIVRTRPIIIRHKKKSNLKFYFLSFLVFIMVSTTTALCMIHNIGPMNEMACFYKQVHNPTYSEMLDFINTDTTDQNNYTGTYVCHNFTMDVIDHAKAKGVEAGYVTLNSNPTNHALVVFRTTDKGIYYLEPQSDVIFSQTQMDAFMNEQRYHLKDENGGIDIVATGYSVNWFSGLL